MDVGNGTGVCVGTDVGVDVVIGVGVMVGGLVGFTLGVTLGVNVGTGLGAACVGSICATAGVSVGSTYKVRITTNRTTENKTTPMMMNSALMISPLVVKDDAYHRQQAVNQQGDTFRRIIQSDLRACAPAYCLW